MAARLSTVLLAVVLWLANACAGARPSLPSSALDALNKQQGIALGVAGVDALAASDAGAASNKHHKKKKKQKPYTSPQGLFIQERASKMLPGPGQHFSFGALKPWADILSLLDGHPNRKLLLLVRHGQAVSNFLEETLGPDELFKIEGACDYKDKNDTTWGLFDADLTDLGRRQAAALNSMLAGGGWFQKLTGGRPVRAVVSPLTRVLHTADEVLKGLSVNATVVEETVRETLGQDTCDARRAASDPDVAGGPKGPCKYEEGLLRRFPMYKFPVYEGGDLKGRSFGLIGDADQLWTRKHREQQSHQVKRAKSFLDLLFANAPEQVVVVLTHSGFTRSLLLAAGREPYRPMNAELVPAIVDKTCHGDQPDADHSGFTNAGCNLAALAAEAEDSSSNHGRGANKEAVSVAVA